MNTTAAPFIEMKVDLINSIVRASASLVTHTLSSHYTNNQDISDDPEFVLWLKPNPPHEVEWASDENEAFFVFCKPLYDHNNTGIFMGFAQRRPGVDSQPNLPAINIHEINDEVGEIIFKYLHTGVLPDVLKAARLN